MYIRSTIKRPPQGDGLPSLDSAEGGSVTRRRAPNVSVYHFPLAFKFMMLYVALSRHLGVRDEGMIIGLDQAICNKPTRWVSYWFGRTARLRLGFCPTTTDAFFYRQVIIPTVGRNLGPDGTYISSLVGTGLASNARRALVAITLLGSYHPGRNGHESSYRLHSFQSREA